MRDERARFAPSEIAAFRDLAIGLADEARVRLRWFVECGFEVKRKRDGTDVTSADLDVERHLRAMIGERYPEHGILGEEFAPHRPDADFRWILDPVDGTEEFVRLIPTFGTVVALYWRGEPLVGVIDTPMLEARVHAAFGLGAFAGDARLRLDDLDPAVPAERLRLALSARANFVRHRDDGALFDTIARAFPNHRIYRSCYAHLLAATGQVDAMVDVGNFIWDIAAARILVEEAGGAYRAVQQYVAGDARVYGTVFGRPSVVERVAALFPPMP